MIYRFAKKGAKEGLEKMNSENEVEAEIDTTHLENGNHWLELMLINSQGISLPYGKRPLKIDNP